MILIDPCTWNQPYIPAWMSCGDVWSFLYVAGFLLWFSQFSWMNVFSFAVCIKTVARVLKVLSYTFYWLNCCFMGERLHKAPNFVILNDSISLFLIMINIQLYDTLKHFSTLWIFVVSHFCYYKFSVHIYWNKCASSLGYKYTHLLVLFQFWGVMFHNPIVGGCSESFDTNHLPNTGDYQI